MKRVLLINPNGSSATTETMVSIAQDVFGHAGSAVVVSGQTNPAAPQMLTTPDQLAMAADDVARMQIPGAIDGVILSAFGDPGGVALAARLECPVVGIGAAAARAAAEGGHRFAVATTTPQLGPDIDMLMRTHGQSGTYLGSFITQGDPQTLLQDPAALDAALISACTAAAQAGAERIIIGGGPLAQAAIRIADQVPAPLIQPLPAACRALIARMA